MMVVWWWSDSGDAEERERERRGGDSGCVPVTPLEDAPDAFPFDERGNRTAVPRCHGHRPSSIPNVSPTA